MEAYGSTVSHAKQLMHGKACEIVIKNDGIFEGLNEREIVGRYHSLSAIKETIPETLEILAVFKG